jgi:hypothetical protein
MKKLLLIGIGIILTHALYSQKSTVVDYCNWSNPVTFELSPSPIIKGYGYYSDSLSSVFDGKRYYEYNDEYYSIESWADYYYWYTKAYWYNFEDPDLYEFYYLTKNDYGMASYIASKKYQGKYYPSLITLNFGELNVINNRLVTNQYLAVNDRRLKSFNRQIGLKKARSINHNSNASLRNQSEKVRVTRTVGENSRDFVRSYKPTKSVQSGIENGSRNSAQSKIYDGVKRPISPRIEGVKRASGSKSAGVSKKRTVVKKKNP